MRPPSIDRSRVRNAHSMIQLIEIPLYKNRHEGPAILLCLSAGHLERAEKRQNGLRPVTERNFKQ